MRVALVFLPFRHHKFSENLKVVDEEFILAPPIILAYIAAILERAGHKVVLIDSHTLKLSAEQTLNELKKFSPDIIGFRTDTYCFQDNLQWIRYLKNMTGLPTIVGGIGITNYPSETMTHPEIDYGIIGEAIESLPALLMVLEKKSDLSTVPGLAWRKNGKIIINPGETKLVNFDEYPFPARHLLPNHLYCSFVSQKRNFTIMLTSRGCPFNCTFCAIAALRLYQERTPKNVVDEIEQCYCDYGIREIDFFDAVLLYNKKRIIEISREIRNRKLDIEWSCRARCDEIDEEVLKEISAAGCREINLGIESASPQILKAINKKLEVAQIERAIKLCHKYRVRALGFLMIGNPEETADTVKETVQFAKKLKLDFVQICRTISKPCSELDQRLKKETGRDYWREFHLGAVGEERLPNPWTTLSDHEIEKQIKLAYYNFYFRPKIIIKTVLRIRSLSEFWRYIKVGLRMIYHYFYWDVPHPTFKKKKDIVSVKKI